MSFLNASSHQISVQNLHLFIILESLSEFSQPAVKFHVIQPINLLKRVEQLEDWMVIFGRIARKVKS